MDFRDNVREARRTNARRDFAQLAYNTILSQLRLQAAVGRLVEADLLNINDLLVPQSSSN